MAESWKAKANRYARGEFTNRELKILLGGMLADQLIDVATYGQLSRLKGKAFMRIVKPLLTRGGAAAVRSIPGLAGTAIAGARFVTLKHPWIVGAVVVYEVVKHRKEIAELAREGWEVISETGQAMAPIVKTEFERLMTEGPRPSPGRGIPDFLGGEFGIPKVKKRPSAFNKAIKSGMLAVKRSTSYGGKGIIKPATKAFSVVTKLASAKKKKRKAPKSGIRRKIWNAMKGLR